MGDVPPSVLEVASTTLHAVAVTHYGRRMEGVMNDCGESEATTEGRVRLLLVFAAGCLLGVTSCKDVQKELDQEAIESVDRTAETLAEDYTKQYEIAKRGGDKMDICVQAGLVAAFYLEAKEESQYTAWKAIQKKDCRRAGL